jgi:hypothetical protein
MGSQNLGTVSDEGRTIYWGRGFIAWPHDRSRCGGLREEQPPPAGLQRKGRSVVGSFKHPRSFDPASSGLIRTTYYEILELLEVDTPLLDVEDDELKSVIIRALIRLYMDGTPQRDWKTKVLSRLPLR